MDKLKQTTISAQEIAWLLKEKYEGMESEAFHADCARLAAGEPLAYVIDFVPFLGCKIWLNSHPLIPRPETEFWVERALAEIKRASTRQDFGTPRVLDLCAGSGCVGVAVAKTVPTAHVTFAEIDTTHLPTIEKNLRENTLIYESKKYPVIQSDLFETVETVTSTFDSFDFILTNPPYIDKAAATIEASVVAHEPALALFGGAHGLAVIKQIIAGARAKLAPPSPTLLTGGQLWIEHEPFQATAIDTLANQAGLYATAYPDQYDTVRYSVLHVPVAQ